MPIHETVAPWLSFVIENVLRARHSCHLNFPKKNSSVKGGNEFSMTWCSVGTLLECLLGQIDQLEHEIYLLKNVRTAPKIEK